MRALWRLALILGGLSGAGAGHALPWTLEVRDSKGQPLAEAVVAVELQGQARMAPRGTRAELGQRERQFQPAVLTIQTGTAVFFPNFDTVRHHVYSFSPIKPFDIKLYSGTPAEPIVFDKPGVAALGCNIHDRMSAHIVVVDTPLFALTDATGRVQLDLPPGQHSVRLWHASLRKPLLQTRSLSIRPQDPALTSLQLVED
jgi:plastocyanin